MPSSDKTWMAAARLEAVIATSAMTRRQRTRGAGSKVSIRASWRSGAAVQSGAPARKTGNISSAAS